MAVSLVSLSLTIPFNASLSLSARKEIVRSETSYSYDPLNRLLRVVYPSGKVTAYQYDPDGNPILAVIEGVDREVRAFSFNASKRLTSRENITYTYGGRGNLVKKILGVETNSHVWDDKNKLISIEYPDSIAIGYTYDAERIEII